MIELVGYEESDDEYPCYLYWIRTESMTDMFSEGYIGITSNVKSRLSGHRLRLENRTEDISKNFVDAYHDNDKLVMQVLSSGTRSEMNVDFYKEAYEHYISGNRTYAKFCRDNGMFDANVTRFFKKFGLKSEKDLRCKKELPC